MQPDQTIVCVDCGGTAHLLTYPPESGEFSPGDVVVYRCSECRDRWDVVIPDPDEGRGDDYSGYLA
ncbi:MAG: hypothetical protein AB7L13_24090 [Acidimicrobiia bacterium]